MFGPGKPMSRRVSSLSYAIYRQYGSEFGLRTRFKQDSLGAVKFMFSKNLKAHFGCVNAIEFSNDGGQWIISGGDDRRVLRWNMEEALSDPCWPNPGSSGYAPSALKGEHNSNIFCLAFDTSNKRIYSGGNDEQVIVHDAATGETVDVFQHSEAVYGLAVDPVNESVFASACDDGRILIYDTRSPPSEDPFCLASYASPMHAVVYNPAEPRLLATANSKEGIGLWDIRKPKNCLLRYGGNHAQQSCMSVRINKTGTQLIALRRRLPPILYNLDSQDTQFQFDHSGYYNSCTMKSCCFAGDKDQYILSGSDDFNLYLWKIPESTENGNWVGKAHVLLNGHRSIVNQVRYNSANNIIISSGVEKVVKVWNPLYMTGALGPLENIPVTSEPTDRPVYTHEEYISLVLHSGNGMTHDYSNQSMEEDPRMMAFFDSLVQRELEGLTSDEVDSEPDLSSRFNNVIQSDSSDQVSNSEEESGYSPFTIAFASVMAQRELEQEVNDVIADRLPELEQAENHVELPPRPPDEAPISILLPGPNNNQIDDIDNLDSSLPGQRPNPNRISISGLIAQKRLEYLASIRKTEKKTKRRPSLGTSSSTQPKRLRMCRFEQSSSSSSSTSSSSESENEKDNTQSSDSVTSRSGLSQEEVRTILGNTTHRKSQLLKWKRLRCQVLNSDSDESVDHAISPARTHTVTSDTGSRSSNTLHCSSVTSDTDKTTETSDHDHQSRTLLSPSCRESSETEKDPEVGECEIGPHISKSSEFLRTKNNVNHSKIDESNASDRENPASKQFLNMLNSIPCSSKCSSSLENNSGHGEQSDNVEFKFKKRSDKSDRRYRGRPRHGRDRENSDDSS